MAIPRIFISSTSKDLKEHRQVAIDTCLKLGALPIAMEYFESMSEDAATGSIRKIDQSDIYVGIFAHRYGYIPEGHTKSVTETEYDYARMKKLPCLIFVIDPACLWDPRLIEAGASAQLLDDFKRRVMKEAIVNFFNTPADLQAKLALSLIYKLNINSDFIASESKEMVDYRKEGQLVIKPGFGMPSTDKAYCGDVFAVLPNSSDYDLLFSTYLKPLADSLYFDIKRFVDLPKHEAGVGISSMWSAIFNARIVVADCTGQNPTVFYQLGIARTISKPMILMANNIEDIPMNFRHLRHIVYENSVVGMEQLCRDLHDAFTHIIVD